MLKLVVTTISINNYFVKHGWQHKKGSTKEMIRRVACLNLHIYS